MYFGAWLLPFPVGQLLTCDCGKAYSQASSLRRHKKTCTDLFCPDSAAVQAALPCPALKFPVHGYYVSLIRLLPPTASQAAAEASAQAADALQQQQPDVEQHLPAAHASSPPLHQVHGAQAPSQPAHHQQQAVLQQPVLALLSSGLPPILLGTFQGDMQRARIILEAAGFLIPLDISSSLLPPGLSPILPQQQAVHAVPALPAALHAELAEMRSDPALAAASADKDRDSSADDMQASPDLQVATVQQAASQGWCCLACLLFQYVKGFRV